MRSLGDLFGEAWKCHQDNELARAEQLYREILQVASALGDVWCCLGCVCQAQGKLAEAEEYLHRGLLLGSNHPAARHALGAALAQQDRLEEAEAIFRQLLAENADDAETHSNLANVLNSQGRHQEAISHCRQALARMPELGTAHNNLGIAFNQLKMEDEAIDSFEQALKCNPCYAEAHINLAAARYANADVAEAEAHCQAALRLRPSNKLRVLLASMLPPLYQTVSQLQTRRQQLVDDIHTLAQDNVRVELANDEPAVDMPNLFYLAYQGLNDRDIQRDFAQLFRPLPFAVNAPQASGSGQSGKIKVGFVSRLFKDHTIGKLMCGLIAKLSRQTFEVTVLSIGHHQDQLARFIQRCANHYVALPAQYPAAAEIVAQQQLDVLIFTDVGMESTSLALAHTRLAPVQCVIWGHPVTTGIDTIDYFISGEALETDESSQHYTEALFRPKTLPIYYYRPTLLEPPKDRSHFGLAAQDHVYACPQSLFKFHPDFDAVLGSILRGDPRGQLVLLQGPKSGWVELLKQRFAATLPDVMSRIRFLPMLAFEDFLNLLAAADVLLDPLHFGGGNTSYEGLAMGTPIVTLPSQFLRGRITFALYQQMEMLDCVAESPEDYVKMALRLGTDADYRASIRRKITIATKALFQNSSGIRELEQFLEQAVAAAATGKRLDL